MIAHFPNSMKFRGRSRFDGLGEALTVLLNEVMLLERSQHLQAQPYERSAERRGYANGYKPKWVRTRRRTDAGGAQVREEFLHQ